MTNEQFTYWLQGFLETANPETITKEQTQIIKDHLNLVFKKVTPNYNLNDFHENGLIIGNGDYTTTIC